MDAPLAPVANSQTSPPVSVKSDRSTSPGPVKRRRLCPQTDSEIEAVTAKGSNTASPSDDGEPSPPSQSHRGGSSSNPSVNGDWELCGNSELRCRLCGYVGQTPRGMKMHNRLHECSGVVNRV